jgi:major membrane immunogen (membrane-anchored lipoprotein)
MCSSVAATPGAQSIAQLLDKLTKPAPAQNPAVSSGASTDSMSISKAAQQLAASAAKAQDEAGQ